MAVINRTVTSFIMFELIIALRETIIKLYWYVHHRKSIYNYHTCNSHGYYNIAYVCDKNNFERYKNYKNLYRHFPNDKLHYRHHYLIICVPTESAI